MNKPRVLLIAANGLGKTGVPHVMMEIVRNLSKIATFDIIVTTLGGYFESEFLSHGGEIIYLDSPKPQRKLGRVFWRLFCFPHSVKRTMANLLKRRQYDCIHSFREDESGHFFKAAHKKIDRRILHINITAGTDTIYQRLRIRQSIHWATDLVAVSEEAGGAFFGKRAFKVILDTYDSKQFRFAEQNAGKKLALLQVATILPNKNQLFSIKVLEAIQKTYPEAMLTIVGGIFDPAYAEALTQYITEKEIKNVSFLPFDADLANLYSSSTCLLLPSLAEAASVVILEAQACGSPCFASMSVPKANNAGGVTYLPLEVEAWAKAIVSIYETERNKRHHYDMSRYSEKTFAEAIRDIYGFTGEVKD